MTANRWRRFADWDARPLRQDRFAREDPAKGFQAMASPADPAPGLAVAEGRVTVMDGVAEADFDLIDRFIARYHLDPAVAAEAMAIPSLDLARMLVDLNVPRADLVRLARGLTPARLAEVVGHLSALEIAFAYGKMRARRSPGNQAHVTNAKDDPLQLAADAAVAVGLGFDEIETTQRVARNAWSNALACAVGASVGRWGTLFQCSSEEAEELQIAMRGFTSYAETVSVYGSEGAFIDGDDTPWSKAFLASAYASRGVKMRATSGAGSELLMGFHQSQSLLYLEARCLCLQRAMGVQGTQNGGIDGAPVTMSVPGGGRELMAENLIAVWLDLECASGNDARPTESELRVGAKIMPYLMAGSDLICSGMGSILKYDNSFNPSLINGEELEDYLVLQRDYEADGGLTPLSEDRASGLRERALAAVAAVLGELGLARPTPAMLASVAAASGSAETDSYTPGDASRISESIRTRGITVIDAIRALATRGFTEEAENLLAMVRLRLSGDALQTSALVRDGRVLSAINDPNEYLGPGTGYRLTPERRAEIVEIRDVLDEREVLRSQAMVEKVEARRAAYSSLGPAKAGQGGPEVVVGISPAFGTKLFRTLAGEGVSVMLRAVVQGIRDGGGTPRVVRMRHTADTSFLGLSAAHLSGSGIGIGLQAKGTAVIHRAGRLPHHNLELFSNAPITTLDHYRRLGENAAALAQGGDPEPVVVPTRGEAMGARFHAEVALIYAIETALCSEGAAPEEVAVEFQEVP
ncbi:propanediol/glycerol family dehydratase large subunit [Rhodobacter sp. Har01]|uniref:propanediol/glycerol family dehydratase large subunit n=1 Tax=Rhodobacter sp. Har01 TaxID=2883999 RepID=UPI001D063E11|nr:propanediol/glycerol family dehydratase large subunit [Rhodobacter sp. Har01]MCB6179322.1 propanediol/glycerol family dehydratase large subunit [Rhodobacter sp. Har01]